jgi:acyl carrier protein
MGEHVIKESEEEIRRMVNDIVAEQMGVDKSTINDATHFVNDLGADSLDQIELIMEFEDTFEFSIEDVEAETITTVGGAIQFIHAKQPGRIKLHPSERLD